MTVTYQQIPGYPRYRAGDDGTVWSCSNVRGWILLKPQATPRGELRVTLCRAGTSKQFRLGRLILTVFVGPCPEGMECLHEDDDPSDNRLSKLRWGTHKENAGDAIRNQKFTQIGIAHHAAKLNPDAVKQILELRSNGMGPVELGKKFGVSHQHICKICKGNSWKEAV